MSKYYESTLSFDLLYNDIESEKIDNVALDGVEDEQFRIRCGEDYVWIWRGDNGETCLKRWGQNNEQIFISTFEIRYKIKFKDEEALELMHFG